MLTVRKILFDRFYELAYRAARRIFFKIGFHLLPVNYYQPIPEETDLSDAFFGTSSELAGLNINENTALDILNNVVSVYLEDFRNSVPLHRNAGIQEAQFHLINGRFMAVDAHVYYAFIRHYRPKRIIEVGGGMSSLLAALACRHLQTAGEARPHLAVIEPFPDDALKKGIGAHVDLIERKVQHLPLSFFAALAEGDILFIDSSHVLRSGGDVQYEYLEILPRLAPGVLVHIHDISLPRAYPRVYTEQGLYWNEQYLLQAFLAFNKRFEVLWPGNYMLANYCDEVSGLFPEYWIMRQCFPDAEPTSFWLRVCQ